MHYINYFLVNLGTAYGVMLLSNPYSSNEDSLVQGVVYSSPDGLHKIWCILIQVKILIIAFSN